MNIDAPVQMPSPSGIVQDVVSVHECFANSSPLASLMIAITLASLITGTCDSVAAVQIAYAYKVDMFVPNTMLPFDVTTEIVHERERSLAWKLDAACGDKRVVRLPAPRTRRFEVSLTRGAQSFLYMLMPTASAQAMFGHLIHWAIYTWSIESI